MNGDLLVVPDVVQEFAERTAESFLRRPDGTFAIALSGGGTARACYEHLAGPAGSAIDWTRTDVFWGDERCVPLDHADSNYGLGREALLDHVAPPHACHPMDCEVGTDRYEGFLRDAGYLDLVHLGLGPDAHTASLFPASPALDADPDRFVVFNHDPSGHNPHRRMTFTFSAIARARLVLVTVSGGAKAEALARVVRGDDVPGARVRGDRVVWIADEAAARDLP